MPKKKKEPIGKVIEDKVKEVDEKVSKKTGIKGFFTFMITAAVVIVVILAHFFGWVEPIGEISKYLIALIDSAACIAGGVLIYKVLVWIMTHSKKMTRRAVTIAKLLTNFCKYLIAIIVMVIVLILWLGSDYVSGVLGGVGILALIIGLGAQSLISDIIAGLFIVFEGRVEVGDIITVGGWRGTVEEVGIRTMVLVDGVGNMKVLNNSSISEFVNLTNLNSLAVCTCGIEYGESLERVEKIIKDYLPKMKMDIPTLLDVPQYVGVDSLADSAVIIKIVAHVKEQDRFQAQRDMNRQIKLLFDKNNINIPFPQVVVNNRESN